MDLNDLIVRGNQAAGNQAALAKLLGVSSMQITHAKANRSGLPAYACFRLAELLAIDATQVIAASELVTEKNPEKRAVFAPFVMGNAEHALSRIAATAAKTVHRASSLTYYAFCRFIAALRAPTPL